MRNLLAWEFLKNPKMCLKDGVRQRTDPNLWTSQTSFSLWKREEEAKTTKRCWEFLNFRSVFKITVLTVHVCKIERFFGEKAGTWEGARIPKMPSTVWKKGIDGYIINCDKFGPFLPIQTSDQFSKMNKEHTLRNSQFSTPLCTENQCNWATLMALLTNFVHEFCHTVFTSRFVQNQTS